MSLPTFIPSALTELDFGTPGRIYRSPMPFSSFDPGRRLLADFQARHISVVVVLANEYEWVNESGMDLLALYRKKGFEVIHCPIVDLSIPNWDLFDQALQAVVERSQFGKHTAVHCLAGLGRTGMFMACLAHKLLGKDGDAAILWVRSTVPPAVEREWQEQFVKEYCA